MLRRKITTLDEDLANDSITYTISSDRYFNSSEKDEDFHEVLVTTGISTYLCNLPYIMTYPDEVKVKDRITGGRWQPYTPSPPLGKRHHARRFRKEIIESI